VTQLAVLYLLAATNCKWDMHCRNQCLGFSASVAWHEPPHVAYPKPDFAIANNKLSVM